MSACEACWSRASQDAMLLGGSVVDHYRRRLVEHEQDSPTTPQGAAETESEDEK